MTGLPRPAHDALAAALAAQDHDTLAAAELPVGLVEAAIEGARPLYPWAATGAGRDCLTNALAGIIVAGWTLHPPGETCSPALPLDLVPHARHGDDEPSTSVEAAARAMPAARSVAFAVLRAYRADAEREHPQGLTIDEATEAVERLRGRPCPGAWRRVSDLEALGLIAVSLDGETGEERTRPGRSGRAQRVHRLTPAGREYIDRLLAGARPTED